MKRAAITFAAAWTLLGAAQAQTTLESAEKTFRAADKNGDNVLTAREAGAASVPTQEFKAFDKDADGNLTRNEWVVFYRDLLVKAKQPISPELDQEADRITGATAGTGGGSQGDPSARGAGGQRAGEARAAESSGGTGNPPTARAEAARRQLQREGKEAGTQDAPGTPASGLEARALAAIGELEARMQDGTLSPEDFRRLQSTLIGDARKAARGTDEAATPLTGTQQRLLAALDELKLKAQDGANASSAELEALRALAIRNAREVEAERKAQGSTERTPDARAAAARGELKQREQGATQGEPTGPGVANDLMSALDRLERRALASEATAEDYRQVRERLIVRARKAARTSGADSDEARGVQRLLAALDTLQAKAAGGRLSQADFAVLREDAIARAREAQAGGDAPDTTGAAGDTGASVGTAGTTGAGTANAPKYSRRLMLALDTLEQRTLEGNASPEDYQRLRDMFIASARRADRTDGSTENGMSDDVARRLQTGLDELERKALRGEARRSDFQGLRDTLVGDVRRAAIGTRDDVRGQGNPEPKPSQTGAGAEPGAVGRGAAREGAGEARSGGARNGRGTGDGQVEPPPARGTDQGAGNGAATPPPARRGQGRRGSGDGGR